MPGQGLIGVKTRTIHQFDCGSKLTHTVSSGPGTNITSQTQKQWLTDSNFIPNQQLSMTNQKLVENVVYDGVKSRQKMLLMRQFWINKYFVKVMEILSSVKEKVRGKKKKMFGFMNLLMGEELAVTLWRCIQTDSAPNEKFLELASISQAKGWRDSNYIETQLSQATPFRNCLNVNVYELS